MNSNCVFQIEDLSLVQKAEANWARVQGFLFLISQKQSYFYLF